MMQGSCAGIVDIQSTAIRSYHQVALCVLLREKQMFTLIIPVDILYQIQFAHGSLLWEYPQISTLVGHHLIPLRTLLRQSTGYLHIYRLTPSLTLKMIGISGLPGKNKPLSLVHHLMGNGTGHR